MSKDLRFSRRVRAYCNKNSIPCIDAKRGQRHHQLAESYEPNDPSFSGVYCIICGRSSAYIWKVERGEEQIRNISREQTYVNHYSFYIVDPCWGRIIIKFGSSPGWVNKTKLPPYYQALIRHKPLVVPPRYLFGFSLTFSWFPCGMLAS